MMQQTHTDTHDLHNRALLEDEVDAVGGHVLAVLLQLAILHKFPKLLTAHLRRASRPRPSSTVKCKDSLHISNTLLELNLYQLAHGGARSRRIVIARLKAFEFIRELCGADSGVRPVVNVLLFAYFLAQNLEAQ